MARVAALVLAGVALAVVGAFGVASLACGERQASAESVPAANASAPPPAVTRCVAFVHPMLPALLVATTLPLVAIARGGGRATALWVGACVAIVTLPWFSLGLVGTLAGLVVVAAGSRVRKGARRDVTPRAPESLALVGLVTMLGFWAVPHAPGDAWFQNAFPLADAVAAAAVLALVASRAPWASALAAIVGGVAVVRDAIGYASAASSDVFASAFVLAAGVAALVGSAPLNGGRGPSTPAR